MEDKTPSVNGVLLSNLKKRIERRQLALHDERPVLRNLKKRIESGVAERPILSASPSPAGISRRGLKGYYYFVWREFPRSGESQEED